jgi:hypothetical protein
MRPSADTCSTVSEDGLELGVQSEVVDARRAVRDGIQQPGMHASGLVKCQINDDGDGSVDPVRSGRATCTSAPSVCTPFSPGRLDSAGTSPLSLDHVPGRVPVHTRIPG